MRLFIEHRRTVAIAAIVGLLCGCSQSATKEGQPAVTSQGSSDTAKKTAGQSSSGKADFQLEASASPANWGADTGKEAKPLAFQRGRLLGQGGGGAGGGAGAPKGPPVDPYLARYSKERLDKAAVIRNYAHVSVMPVGIDAFVKTAWTSGNVHIRLALLGPIDHLRTFNETQRDVKLTFQDRAGNPLQVIIVPTSEMKEAPQSVNFGTPTYVVEGAMDCPLELYEQYYQWMFEWE